MNTNTQRNWRPLLLLMGALLAWGVLHAVGAYLFDMDYRKPIVVYGFMGGFLACWTILLALRSRRLAQQHDPPADKPQDLKDPK